MEVTRPVEKWPTDRHHMTKFTENKQNNKYRDK